MSRDLLRRRGKLRFLRVHHRGGFGDSNSDDFIADEVVAQLDSERDHYFGLPLNAGTEEKLPAYEGMFHLLRDGLVHDVETTIDYYINTQDDHSNGEILRVELRRTD